MIENQLDLRYTDTTLEFESVEGPDRSEGNNVDYYTVKMLVEPPLSDDCSHAFVKMRYSNFKKLFQIFEENVHVEGTRRMSFPQKRSASGALRDAAFWIDTSEEKVKEGAERRAFFENLLGRIFGILGSRKPPPKRNFYDDFLRRPHSAPKAFQLHLHPPPSVNATLSWELFHAFYSDDGDGKGQAKGMYSEGVEDMYDCRRA